MDQTDLAPGFKKTWRTCAVLCAAFTLMGPAGAMAASPRLASQFNHTLVVRSDGSLWAWGDNQFGELGYDTTTDQDPSSDSSSEVPQQVGTDSDWLSAATGENFSLALKTDGSLYAWGLNSQGQAGQDPALFPVVPAPTQIAGQWSEVAAGTFHAVGLRRDGSLWAWGYNRHGELGLGTFDSDPHPVPAQIGADTDWVAVDTRGYHSLALKANGGLWGWGDNTSGQCGQPVPQDGSGDFVLRPTRIGTDTDWAAVAGALFFSMGLKVDGSLWAWGNNTFGQLGTGVADPTPNDPPAVHEVPTRVGSANDWLWASGGEMRGLGIRAGGTLWAWGETGGAVSGPVQVGAASNWVAVTGGGAMLDRSGTVAAWSGDAGQSPAPVASIAAGSDTTPPTASVSPPAGTYQQSVSVVLSGTDDSTMRPLVRYTTDGSEPGPTSPIFAAPLTFDRTATVKFFAEDASGNLSATTTAEFVVPTGGGGGGGGCFLDAASR